MSVSSDIHRNNSLILTLTKGFTRFAFDLSLINNTELTNVKLPITKIGHLEIQSNGTPMKIELPDLQTIDVLKLSHVSELDVPSFSGQSGSIQISNSQISNLQMDNIEWFDEVILRDNSDLRSVSFKSLGIVGNGDLDIIGSPHLSSIDLTSLKLVSSSFNISGNFTE